jgi:hypothetical protein
MATAGIPLGCRWDRKKGIFRFRYRAEAAIQAPTEIFTECLGDKPEYSYKAGGRLLQKIEYAPFRILIYHGDYNGEVELELRRGGNRRPLQTPGQDAETAQ